MFNSYYEPTFELSNTRLLYTGTVNEAQPRWLNDEEMKTWKAVHLLTLVLPEALGRQLQSDADLSFMEYYVLAGLSEQSDHSLCMGELALLTNAEPSRLSHLMTRMTTRGLVLRERDPSDRRFMRAVLTDKGHRLLREAAPGHVARVRELIFDVLDTDLQQCLQQAAQQIVNHLLEGGACNEHQPTAAEVSPGW